MLQRMLRGCCWRCWQYEEAAQHDDVAATLRNEGEQQHDGLLLVVADEHLIRRKAVEG